MQVYKSIAQGESALDVLEILLTKTAVAAQASGVVLSLNLEQGIWSPRAGW